MKIKCYDCGVPCTDESWIVPISVTNDGPGWEEDFCPSCGYDREMYIWRARKSAEWSVFGITGFLYPAGKQPQKPRGYISRRERGLPPRIV